MFNKWDLNPTIDKVNDTCYNGILKTSNVVACTENTIARLRRSEQNVLLYYYEQLSNLIYTYIHFQSKFV